MKVKGSSRELWGAIWIHKEPKGVIRRHIKTLGAIGSHREPYGGIESQWSYRDL